MLNFIALSVKDEMSSMPIFIPPLKKEGHIALHMLVGMSVGRYVSGLVHVCRYPLTLCNW